MRLPDSDWLPKAKALAIGAKASIYHQGERTPALNIANLPDRWTAYCHRCKAKSVVMKTTVKLTLDAPKKSYADRYLP